MKIIIIKIGSSVIMTKRNKLDEFRLAHIADQIISLQQIGISVVLVVSGAVACGIFTTNKSDSMKMWGSSVLKRAAGGIGQLFLVSTLLKVFEQKKLKIAQILLNKKDLKSQLVRDNLLETVSLYFHSGIIPIFNENDVLELNSFGGNDLLAAQITMFLKADKLLILSTQEGSVFGVGGKETKLKAVSLLKEKNIRVSIVNGKEKNILLQSIL